MCVQVKVFTFSWLQGQIVIGLFGSWVFEDKRAADWSAAEQWIVIKQGGVMKQNASSLKINSCATKGPPPPPPYLTQVYLALQDNPFAA